MPGLQVAFPLLDFIDVGLAPNVKEKSGAVRGVSRPGGRLRISRFRVRTSAGALIFFFFSGITRQFWINISFLQPGFCFENRVHSDNFRPGFVT
jgi:hypothetical protein